MNHLFILFCGALTENVPAIRKLPVPTSSNRGYESVQTLCNPKCDRAGLEVITICNVVNGQVSLQDSVIYGTCQFLAQCNDVCSASFHSRAA